MERSLVMSEDTKGRLILDSGNELFAKRVTAIQKRKADAEHQEQKKPYIDALISLAKSEFDISKEELSAMSIQEFHAFQERIYERIREERRLSRMKSFISGLVLCITVYGTKYTVGQEFFALACVFLYLSLISLWIFLIFLLTMLSDLYDEGDMRTVRNNRQFAKELLPADITK